MGIWEMSSLSMKQSHPSLWQFLDNSISVQRDPRQTFQLIFHFVVPWSVLSPSGGTGKLYPSAWGHEERGLLSMDMPRKVFVSGTGSEEELN